MVGGCGQGDCTSNDRPCEDEIFHVDGEAVYETLVRWLIIAAVALVAVVLLRSLVLWIRHRWYPRDVDW